MEIIKRRQHFTDVTYMREFDHVTPRTGGFSFPCDKDGNIIPQTNPAAQANLVRCMAGTGVIDRGVHEYTSRRIEPAVGLCNDCGHEVVLAHFTNTCECGSDFNSSGQQLAPREFWGEETGEHWTDVANIA